jgi:hypothetical protein
MSAIKVFCSYPRTQASAVAQIASQMEQMGAKVWHDRELSGGQEWWDTILGQIQRCDCFVFLLCEDALESKACRAELDYAHATNRIILPLGVGDPVPDGVLPRFLSKLQRVDAADMFQVARALVNLPERQPPPTPLPPPPPVPISYLDELAQVLERPELSLAEQRNLMGALRHRLVNSDDPGAALTLLHRMRRRADVNAGVAADIDAELARFEQPATVAASTSPPPWSAGPSGAPAWPPAPPAPAPAPAPRRARGRWAALVTAGVLVAGAVGASIVARADGSGPPVPPTPTTPVPPPPAPDPPVPVTRDALPGDYGDDPIMDDLADSCGAGDLDDCDDLYSEAPADTDYELFGRTCGARVPLPFDGTCSSGFYDSLTDAVWACSGGDMDACDAVYVDSGEGSLYELFGSTCGVRSDEPLDGDCALVART